MAINALIARGITPVGEGVPQTLMAVEQMKLGRTRNALAQQDLANARRVNALADNPSASPEDYARLGRPDIGNSLLAASGQRAEADQRKQDAIGRLGDAAAHALTLDPSSRRAFVKQITHAPAFASVFEALGVDPAAANIDGTDDAAMESNLKQIAAYSRKPADTGPLEQVVGPDGKPRFTTRAQALGQTPYVKPEGAPSSYDEFSRARENPEYAQFLKDRRGKGMSVTTPDGTVIDIGGDRGAIDAGELTSPTRNKLQESIVQSTDDLDRLNSAGASFDPKFLTIQGKAMGMGLKLKDISGGLFGSMRPDERDFLRRYTGFRADANRNLTMVLKRLSGAAITPSEGARVAKGLPTEDDSPTEYQAKFESSTKDLTRGIMRANWALRNGIGVKSVEDLSRTMPLAAIDRVYADRANEIWQALGGAPEKRQQAIQAANREFGVSR